MSIRDALKHLPKTKLNAYKIKLFIMLILFGDIIEPIRKNAEIDDYRAGYANGWQSTYEYFKKKNLIK